MISFQAIQLLGISAWSINFDTLDILSNQNISKEAAGVVFGIASTDAVDHGIETSCQPFP